MIFDEDYERGVAYLADVFGVLGIEGVAANSDEARMTVFHNTVCIREPNAERGEASTQHATIVLIVATEEAFNAVLSAVSHDGVTPDITDGVHSATLAAPFGSLYLTTPALAA